MTRIDDRKRAFRAVVLPAAVAVASIASATAPRYVVHENAGEPTVEDIATGLTWQQRASDHPMTMNWGAALRHCEELTWAGVDDWRLPDVVELSTIVDERRTAAPAINTLYFVGFDGAFGYWTSTTARQAAGSAYVLYFNEQDTTVGRGGTGVVNKTASMRALCVRGER